MQREPAGMTEQLTGLRPMRAALARMVAALRGGIGLVAVVSALLIAGGPVSWWWVGPAVAVVVGWTSVYVWVAWTQGLRAWLIGVDLLIAAALCLAVGKLVPPSAVSSTLSWVLNIASVAVVSAQLAGLPIVSVPAGWLVAASIVTGSWLAHSADDGVPAGLIIAVQAVAAAAVMMIAMRTERTAVASFADLERAQAAATLASARREAERAQMRLVHNGPLTTLTMALHADALWPGRVLSQRAAAALDTLPQLAASPGIDATEVRLDERLAQVVVWYEPMLSVTASLQACSVTLAIAEAFAGAVAEALENIVRYAATQRATVSLRDQENAVTVTVADQGRGFYPGELPGLGFGLREDLVGRMSAVGATAVVNSAPGVGTAVHMEWRRA